MLNDGTTRLEWALELLGYQQAKEPNHKTNLLHAIQVHAGLIGNKELEVACDAEVEHIRTENKAKSGSVDVEVNVGDCQRNSGEKLKPGMVQIKIGRNQRNFMGDFYE